jgi:hypothetical protein
MSKSIAPARNLTADELVNTAKVANAAREYLRENGHEVGTRGRLSVEQFTIYFMRAPKTARVLAAALDLPVDGKGFVKKETAVALATAIR